MTWQINWDENARRSLHKLDKQNQREIIAYLDTRVATSVDPRTFGKPLLGSLAGLWRYRIHDHRIICKIEDKKLTILILHIAHRRSIYDL